MGGLCDYRVSSLAKSLTIEIELNCDSIDFRLFANFYLVLFGEFC